jgi:NAD(P) transhydrogenase subunit beta
VNPAAENNPDSPVYGMPIIRAHESKQVIVVKRSMNKGYAGVQNDLFALDNCKILFGDAKVSLQEIVNQLKLI